jgi:hypothetical protein
MKLFLTVALSLTAIALVAHAQEAPSYPPPPGPPSQGYTAAPLPPDMPPANTEIIPPAPPSYVPPPAQQAVTPSTAMPQDQAQDQASSGPQPQTQGNVTFVSGGAGDEDRDALKAMENQYNLRLLFAVRGSGAFLAGVNVTLTDAQGHVALDTTSDGPIFYAHVPAGRYKLTVSDQGQSQSATVSVSSTGAVAQSFYWTQAS